MKEFNYAVAGMCFGIGLLCMVSGSPVIGGVNLFLAVLNYKMAERNG